MLNEKGPCDNSAITTTPEVKENTQPADQPDELEARMARKRPPLSDDVREVISRLRLI